MQWRKALQSTEDELRLLKVVIFIATKLEFGVIKCNIDKYTL